MIAETIAGGFRRLGTWWSALAAGRWRERVLAGALAILVIIAVSAAGVGIVYGLIHAPSLIIAGVGLLVFAGAFLRYVWWGTGR